MSKDQKCNHIGKFGNVSQSVFFTGDKVLVICTQNCTNCGHLLTNINPLEVSVPQILPSMPILPNIKK